MNSSIGLVGLRRSIRDYAESPQQEPGSDQRFASKIRPTRHDPAPGIMEDDAELRSQRPAGACESGRSAHSRIFELQQEEDPEAES